ncbi:MAG: hypothetical protein V1739_00215 [Candidatus Omnitrophota bacterium]
MHNNEPIAYYSAYNIDDRFITNINKQSICRERMDKLIEETHAQPEY